MSRFYLGSFCGAPIHVSFWTVAYFAYCILEACHDSQLPTWFILSFAILCQLVLQGTILVHEFGHGFMARHLGGTIHSILLWPFGGICSISMPQTESRYVKISNELKIVCAGPATHIFQTFFWIKLVNICYTDMHVVQLLNPFTSGTAVSELSMSSLLLLVMVQAIKVNVLLFLFNALFPMYPMDAAKMLVSLLQLCFGFTPKTTAKSLVGFSGISSLLFIAYFTYLSLTSSASRIHLQMSVILGCMCFGEVLNLLRLISDDKLHEHPLFTEQVEVEQESAPFIKSKV